MRCPLQLFYKTHILGFLGFMLFGFMHHTSLFAYTMPGMRAPALPPALRGADLQHVQASYIPIKQLPILHPRAVHCGSAVVEVL